MSNLKKELREELPIQIPVNCDLKANSHKTNTTRNWLKFLPWSCSEQKIYRRDESSQIQKKYLWTECGIFPAVKNPENKTQKNPQQQQKQPPKKTHQSTPKPKQTNLPQNSKQTNNKKS